MARMYPRRLHDADVKSNAERKVFEALRDDLDDDWEAFHSTSWIDRDPIDGASDGEIDFVLCHPRRAVVALEVKGGGIECQHGEWYRLPAGGGPRERMPDPFQVALDHRYELERLLAGRGAPKDLRLVHALALPNVTVHQLALAPDAPRELLIDRNDVESIAGALDRVLRFHAGARDGERAPGEEGAELLRELIAPTVRIEVPMAEEFLEEEQALIELTHEQSMLLANLWRNRRLAVYGCAGSGKTMLAVEHAKRLARRGEDVLFVCFSKRLRDHLREHEAGKGVTFHTFHGLCHSLAAKAGIKLPRFADDEVPPQAYFEETLPDALVEAAAELGEQFDAVIVDEAQDLRTEWLDSLLVILRDPDKAAIWLFLDDNQDVFGSGLEIPDGYTRWDLSVNCRNTQAIHAEVMKKYRGEIEPQVKGPPGRTPEIVFARDQPRAVAAALARLCGREEVPPQDVVVLSSHGAENSAVYNGLPGEYRLVDERGKHGKCVYFSSIRGFKGLESPVVILCELEDIDDMSMDSQLYVGISRARNHCVVVAPG